MCFAATYFSELVSSPFISASPGSTFTPSLLLCQYSQALAFPCTSASCALAATLSALLHVVACPEISLTQLSFPSALMSFQYCPHILGLRPASTPSAAYPWIVYRARSFAAVAFARIAL